MKKHTQEIRHPPLQWVCGTRGVLYVPSAVAFHLDGPPIHAALPHASTGLSPPHQAGQTARCLMPTCVSCLERRMDARQTEALLHWLRIGS
jgi:hypothetical protein